MVLGVVMGCCYYLSVYSLFITRLLGGCWFCWVGFDDWYGWWLVFVIRLFVWVCLGGF